MKATRNWGMIRTGETFEALVTTLLFFEDSGARLFGRRGRDGGQDARSGDDKTVYQAKHHVNGTAAAAIKDAKAEAAKIKEYRTPGHARHEQWKTVTDWILVTNASFNPTDERTWQGEIVPLFAGLGITAKYWEEATLDALLDKHPEVDRSFFQNENRIFLSPAEACRTVAKYDRFLGRAELAPYVGREADLAEFDRFLGSEKAFLTVHAAGGIGKTRFLLEGACNAAAQGDWEVLWANVHSMTACSTWFAAVPQRQTLIVIDEPEDARLVPRLKEQLGGRKGKIVIAVRSAKDPVLRALRHPDLKQWVEELVLEPLSRAECTQICRTLMDTGPLASTSQDWKDDVAKTLSRRFDGYPIWLTLAVRQLEEDGNLANLPKSAAALCRLYLEEALQKGQREEKHRDVARWVALLGPINREDDGELQYLAERSGFEDVEELQRALKELVSVRLLRKWGANDRLVDVKPDVLRDFIVQEWLCEKRDHGEIRVGPSNAAKGLVAELTQSMIHDRAGQREERVLAAFARIDFLLRQGESPVQLGAPLFAALDAALPKMTASQRIAMVEKISKVGPYYPGEILRLLRRFRLEPASDETVDTVLGTTRYSQSDVVQNLASAHGRLAQGLLSDEQRRTVFEELYSLVAEEQQVAAALAHGLPNDGKRADGVIRTLLENGPGYAHEFGDVAADVVLSELESGRLQGLDEDRLVAFRAVVKPLCEVQRHQTWSDGPTFTMGNQHLLSNHPNMLGRSRVLGRLRAILEKDSDVLSAETAVSLWSMLSEVHTRTHNAKGMLDPEHRKYAAELKKWLHDDLLWATRVLDRRELSPRELRAARKMWSWHAKYGEGRTRTLASKLDRAYLSNPTVRLFESLTNWDDRDGTDRMIEAKCAELALGGWEAIEAFLSDAESFFGEKDLYRVHSVAHPLGRIAGQSVPVRRFLFRGLREYERGSPRFKFVLNGLSAWVFTQRRALPERAAKLVEELLYVCPDGKKLEVLRELYGHHRPLTPALMASESEAQLVRRYRGLFQDQAAVKDFVACALWGAGHDWADLQSALDEVLSSTNGQERTEVTRMLVEELQTVLAAEGSCTPPPELLRWLWNQLVATPDLYLLKHGQRWYVDKIIEKLGHAPIAWLPEATRIREKMHGDETGWRTDPPHRLLPLTGVLDTQAFQSAEVRAAVDELCGLLLESNLFSFWLPKLLARLDPEGLVVPATVAAMAELHPTERSLRAIGQVAFYYKVASPSWRVISRAVFAASADLPKEEREGIYSKVSDNGRRSTVSAPGEVPRLYVDAVTEAEVGLASETESAFVPFWEWLVARRKRELHSEREQLKEEVWD